MKLNLKLQDIYIPNWKNNKDLPENEQIKIHFKYLTLADRESLIDKNISIMALSKKIWNNNVIKIEGLNITVDGETIEFKPQSIFDLPDLNELFEETTAHIITASSLTEVQKKN